MRLPSDWIKYCVFALLLSGLVPVQAADVPDKPFAEAKVAIQISDPHPFKQKLALNVASNLIKYYGQDKVAIEIVAFGPGLRLLFNDNAHSARVQSLSDAGVRFSACSNTVANMGKKLGHPPKLAAQANTVDAGVVRLLELKRAGYDIIKP